MREEERIVKRSDLSKREITCMNKECQTRIDLENGFGYVKRPKDAEPEIRCQKCYDKLPESEQKAYSSFPYLTILQLLEGKE